MPKAIGPLSDSQKAEVLLWYGRGLGVNSISLKVKGTRSRQIERYLKEQGLLRPRSEAVKDRWKNGTQENIPGL